MTEEQKEQKEIPTIYQPITLNVPPPQNEEQLVIYQMVGMLCHYAEFMRQWRSKRKSLFWQYFDASVLTQDRLQLEPFELAGQTMVIAPRMKMNVPVVSGN